MSLYFQKTHPLSRGELLHSNDLLKSIRTKFTDIQCEKQGTNLLTDGKEKRKIRDTIQKRISRTVWYGYLLYQCRRVMNGDMHRAHLLQCINLSFIDCSSLCARIIGCAPKEVDNFIRVMKSKDDSALDDYVQSALKWENDASQPLLLTLDDIEPSPPKKKGKKINKHSAITSLAVDSDDEKVVSKPSSAKSSSKPVESVVVDESVAEGSVVEESVDPSEEVFEANESRIKHAIEESIRQYKASKQFEEDIAKSAVVIDLTEEYNILEEQKKSLEEETNKLRKEKAKLLREKNLAEMTAKQLAAKISEMEEAYKLGPLLRPSPSPSLDSHDEEEEEEEDADMVADEPVEASTDPTASSLKRAKNRRKNEMKTLRKEKKFLDFLAKFEQDPKDFAHPFREKIMKRVTPLSEREDFNPSLFFDAYKTIASSTTTKSFPVKFVLWLDEYERDPSVSPPIDLGKKRKGSADESSIASSKRAKTRE